MQYDAGLPLEMHTETQGLLVILNDLLQGQAGKSEGTFLPIVADFVESICEVAERTSSNEKGWGFQKFQKVSSRRHNELCLRILVLGDKFYTRRTEEYDNGVEDPD